MRRRLIVAAGVLVTAGLVLAACSRGDEGGTSEPGRTAGLARRTIRAGEVDVTLEPIRLDAGGAVFEVVLDTHSVELSMDLAAAARLEVGGTTWKVAGWRGDGPGGHHRKGELRFTATGPPQGTVRLTLSGLPEPVEATWNLGS